MSFHVEVLADSMSPDGVRLTTLEATFPRFILAEINTHRMLSRNSASSRAIPTEKLIERVTQHPFVPLTFNKRVKGMGVGDPLEDQDAIWRAQNAWNTACADALSAARALNEIGIDKSRVNRLLEPFMWHTAIISATEWDNFFALRDHPAAQPEFQMLAKMMRSAIEMSSPVLFDYGGHWHLPLVTAQEKATYDGSFAWYEQWTKISASRCARVSYNRQHDDETLDDALLRAERLMTSGHLSPFEHVARPMEDSFDRLRWGRNGDSIPTCFAGNFRGWVQMRKEIPYEDNFGALSGLRSPA